MNRTDSDAKYFILNDADQETQPCEIFNVT